MIIPSWQQDVPCLLQSVWQTTKDPWNRVFQWELCTNLGNIYLLHHGSDADNSEDRHKHRILL